MFFFLIDPAPTEIYTLSLHDALPIFQENQRLFQNSLRRAQLIILMNTPSSTRVAGFIRSPSLWKCESVANGNKRKSGDRKSTRLNSSHTVISYAVFCLKKKKKTK